MTFPYFQSNVLKLIKVTEQTYMITNFSKQTNKVLPGSSIHSSTARTVVKNIEIFPFYVILNWSSEPFQMSHCDPFTVDFAKPDALSGSLL